MKKGIRAHDVSASGLENIAKRCKEMGMEYIQLALDKSVEGIKYGDFSPEYAAELKAQLGDIKIAVLGSYINPSSSDEETLKTGMDKFKEKIRYASIMKPIVVGTETGYYGSELSVERNNTEEVYQYFLKNMRELVAEAEKYDVTIGIEGVQCFVINTPQRMARMLEDLNSDNVRVIFDPVNYLNIDNYTRQDQIINDAFDLFADKIVAVHAKDFVVEDNQMKKVIHGEGILNYELIFKRLKEHNPDIPIISEEIDDEKALKGFENLEFVCSE